MNNFMSLENEFIDTLERALKQCSPVEYAIPIKDIKVYPDSETGKDKIVIVSFFDGTQEKAVCDNEDTFSLEQGITICLMKYFLSALTGEDGTKEYNKTIRKAVKLYNRRLRERTETLELQLIERERKAKKLRKHKARAERKRKEEDERQIKNYTEAIRRIEAEQTEKPKKPKAEKKLKKQEP